MHLTDADIVLLLRRGITGKRFEELKVHLADCSECTERVAFVDRTQEFLRDSSAPALNAKAFERAINLVGTRSILLEWILALIKNVRFAVGALSVIVVVGVVILLRNDQEPSRFRAGSENQLVFHLSPSDEATLTPNNRVFRWSAVASAYGYRIEIFDPSGLSLWRSTLTDTIITLPAELKLQEGTSYLWRVEALLQDTRTLRSELQRFAYAPENAH